MQFWSRAPPVNCQLLGTPKCLKSITNVIIGDLRRSKRIRSYFIKEKIIKDKFKKADFPTKFIDSVIKYFEYNERNKDQQDDFIMPPYLFEEPKPRTLVKFPFCKL